MATDLITQERLKSLLTYDPDTGEFRWAVDQGSRGKLGDVAGTFTAKGYRYIRIARRGYMAHRLAWLYMTGNWPAAQVDHINRLKHDNRWVNLRAATNVENAQNQPVRCTNRSGVTGVHYYPRYKKWCASIRANRKRVFLGYFDKKDDAVAARKAAEITRQPFRNPDAAA
jgi:hypothetical protein